MENMKIAFLKKHEEINEQMEEQIHLYKKKLWDLQEEYDHTKHLKEVFLKQISDIRKFQKF